MGTAGTATSALAFGGELPPGTAKTESWNGTSWTEVNDLNTSRRFLNGAGANNTSALAMLGNQPGSPTQTEEWNGTNWSNKENNNTARNQAAGTGTTVTAAIVFGGDPIPSTGNLTEEWYGTGLVTSTVTTTSD